MERDVKEGVLALGSHPLSYPWSYPWSYLGSYLPLVLPSVYFRSYRILDSASVLASRLVSVGS